MTKTTCIIIDDEQDSRSILQNYVGKYCKNLEVLDTCENIQTAQIAIQKHQPQLLFLDIEMPYGNAFDLLEQVEEINFEIIFITAFSQYAVQAFNQSAVHYMLKPVDIDELILAVDKAKERIHSKEKINHAQILLENLSFGKSQKQKIALPLIDGFEVVRLKDVLYCEADDNFTCFYFLDGRKSLICRKLKFYETNLQDHGFSRIHRSFLINMEYVKRYIKGKGGTVIMQNDTQLQVSNTRKAAFLKQFEGY